MLSTNWNDGKCMSIVASKKQKCNLKVKKNDDFCSKHNKKKDYDKYLLKKIRLNDCKKFGVKPSIIKKEMISHIIDNELNKKILNFKISNESMNKLNDQKFNYSLMGLYNSWDEIKFYDQIYVDNELWDINIIINHITYQLNNSNMENPYPIYPNNPFTRKSFSPKSLMLVYNRILFLNKSVNISLKLFLSQSENFLQLFYEESLTNLDRFSRLILNLFLKNLRFMIVNCKNSQDCYIGHWVNTNHPVTQFEILYDRLKNAPYQIYENGYIVNNYRRDILRNILLSYPVDNYDLTNNFYCN